MKAKLPKVARKNGPRGDEVEQCQTNDNIILIEQIPDGLARLVDHIPEDWPGLFEVIVKKYKGRGKNQGKVSWFAKFENKKVMGLSTRRQALQTAKKMVQEYLQKEYDETEADEIGRCPDRLTALIKYGADEEKWKKCRG